jgi:hypothetical protein
MGYFVTKIHEQSSDKNRLRIITKIRKKSLNQDYLPSKHKKFYTIILTILFLFLVAIGVMPIMAMMFSKERSTSRSQVDHGLIVEEPEFITCFTHKGHRYIRFAFYGCNTLAKISAVHALHDPDCEMCQTKKESPCLKQ